MGDIWRDEAGRAWYRLRPIAGPNGEGEYHIRVPIYTCLEHATVRVHPDGMRTFTQRCQYFAQAHLDHLSHCERRLRDVLATDLPTVRYGAGEAPVDASVEWLVHALIPGDDMYIRTRS